MYFRIDGNTPTPGASGSGNNNNVARQTTTASNFNFSEAVKNLSKGITKEVTGKDIERALDSQEVHDIRDALGIKGKDVLTPVPTQENKDAKTQLDAKVSSTGISYGDAEKTINDIKEKYKGDEYFTEWDETVDPNKDIDNTKHTLLYERPYIKKHKEFNPDKLPEPDRTNYKEAVEAKHEIENNNKALKEKAGSLVKSPENNDYNNKRTGSTDISQLDISKLTAAISKPKEKTEKQKNAYTRLESKQSSTGVSYKDAKAKLEEIKNKYKNNPDCQSKFEQEQPKNSLLYYPPVTGFDPYKLPEPARTEYFTALKSLQEIETNNSALVAQAGETSTPTPENPALKSKYILY